MGTDKHLSQAATAAIIAKLRLAGYKVRDFGTDGHSVEVEGTQLFRATAVGNGLFAVRLNEGVFPDV